MIKYNHAEAYCLMLYKCKTCGCEEILWNSRDGVTPFVIGCRNCEKESYHVDWQNDLPMPNFKPASGQRIFIDITREKAEEIARKRIESFRGTEYEVAPEDEKETLESVTDSIYHNGEAPVIKVWEGENE